MSEVREDLGYTTEAACPPVQKSNPTQRVQRYKQASVQRINPEIDRALDQLLTHYSGSYDARGRLTIVNEAKVKMLDIWPLTDCYFEYETQRYGRDLVHFIQMKLKK